MKLRKIIMGLCLGMLLSVGISGRTEAKTEVETITVKVDKADMATAKKTDAALKEGKQVVLKVKGSKKASRKLLLKLQKRVADYNKYGVMFDLSRSLSNEGNAFQNDFRSSYYWLDYKQAGDYGKYTIWKSRCSAYKWALKLFEKNFKKSKYYKILKQSTEEAYQKYCKEIQDKCIEYRCDYLYNLLYDMAEKDYAAYVPADKAQKIYEDKTDYAADFWDYVKLLCSTITGNKFNREYGEEWILNSAEDLWENYQDCFPLYEMLKERADTVDIDSIDVADIVSDIPATYYDYLVKMTGKKSLADFWTGKRNSLDTSDIDIVKCLLDMEIKHDADSAGDIYWNSTANCFKKLYKGTAKGVHGLESDFDRAYSNALEYLGIRSYEVYHYDGKSYINCCMFSSVSLGAKKKVLYMYLYGKLYSATEKEYYNPDPHMDGFHSYLLCDSSKYAESHTLEKVLRMKGGNAYTYSMGADFPFKRKYVAWKKKK